MKTTLQIAAPEDRFNVRAEAAKVTPADALDAAKCFFPGGAKKAALLPGGFSNANYRIETAQGAFVLRFFWNGQRTGEREITVLKLCAQHGIRVPKVWPISWAAKPIIRRRLGRPGLSWTVP